MDAARTEGEMSKNNNAVACWFVVVRRVEPVVWLARPAFS
jgi:hypothetical protein